MHRSRMPPELYPPQGHGPDYGRRQVASGRAILGVGSIQLRQQVAAYWKGGALRRQSRGRNHGYRVRMH